MEITVPILEQLSQGSIVSKLVGVAASFLSEQYFWEANLKKELEKLISLLPQIQVVVEFAERNTNTAEGPLIQWLWQFRDCIDHAQEVLDDLEYIQLEKKANKDETKLSKAVGASIRNVKRVMKSDNDVLKKLRKCMQKLSTVAQSSRDFIMLMKEQDDTSNSKNYLHQQLHSVVSERTTTPLPASTLFEGRKDEKERIIQALIEEPKSEDTPNVLVLPLVGMGGIGKTTLAQQVYNHFEDKKAHFDITIWICVSTDFNVVNLTKRILKSLEIKFDSESELGILQKKIIDNLRSKRFLLVLDDVWNDSESDDWERLCFPLQKGQKGSRILLTTRLDTVVERVKKVEKRKDWSLKPMNLGKLSTEECRSILHHYAFANKDPGEHPELTRVGEKIIVKLQGVPLLAKTIGGVLSSKLDSEHWNKILETEIWKIPQNSKDDFIPALTISYYMLLPHLKRCFAYCSIFPPDYAFERKELVNMWIAAGLIQPQQFEDSEDDMAEQCFGMLYRKSFFDVHPNYKDRYVMHDMLHALACHVSRKECCRVVHEQPKDIPHTIRHLSITSTSDELPALAKMVGKLRHLRTLIIEYDGHAKKLHDFIQEACASPKSIRILAIDYFDSKSSDDKRWMNNIRKMANLRYLALPRVEISSKVLESVCRFYFLQVLHANQYDELPGGMNKLINLKHLYTGYFSDPFNNSSSIFKIGNMTSLQELSPYRVGTKKGHKIDELRDMNDLRDLHITDLHNVRSSEEAKMTNLQMKKKLNSLKLSWGDGETSNKRKLSCLKLPWGHGKTSNNDPEHDKEVLEELISPPNINELEIENYRGATWMSCTQILCNLQSLEISSCPGWEELPPLWELLKLKHLKLENMDAVKRFGPEASNNEVDKPLFPSLETLQIEFLRGLQKWDDADNYKWFPRLRDLQIQHCSELKKIPSLPSSSLEKLIMTSLGLTSLPRSYNSDDRGTTAGSFQKLSALQTLKLQKCVDLVLQENICEITSLKELEIDDCPKFIEYFDNLCANKLPLSQKKNNLLPESLTHLTFSKCNVSSESLSQYLQSLTSLVKLEIWDCPKISSLPKAELLHELTEIKKLEIAYCNELHELESLRALPSLESLKIQECPKILSLPKAELLHELTAIKKFEIAYCNELHELESLRALTSLESLTIQGCPKILSLPKAELLHELTAIKKLEIVDCNELHELESLRALTSLEILTIKKCPKLCSTATEYASKNSQTREEEKGILHSLEDILIDNIFYIPILPPSDSIRSIGVWNESSDECCLPRFNSIPNEIMEWLSQGQKSMATLDLGHMPQLQTLPEDLKNFSSLEELFLRSARQLRSLPMMPDSLGWLYIEGCSRRLKKRCQENVGDDWPNIKHIHFIRIMAYKSEKSQGACLSFTRLCKSACLAKTTTGS